MNAMAKAVLAAGMAMMLSACGDLDESSPAYPAAAAPAAVPASHGPSVILIEEPSDGLATRFTAAGDLNGDGHSDLVLGRSTIDPAGPAAVVTIYFEDASHTLPSSPDVTFTLDPAAADGALGDFDGDGRLDLAVAVFSDPAGGRIELHRGNGDGTFQVPVTVADGIDAVFIGTGDFNADGLPDLVVSGSLEVRIYPNAGGGSFGAPGTLPFPAYFDVADTDGDGRSELLVIEWMWDASVKIYGDLLGAPSLLATLPLPADHVGTSLAASDMDGDGRIDVITGSVEPVAWTSGNTRVFYNSAAGFGDWTDAPAAAPVMKVASVDYDGDGRRDLAWYEEGAANQISFSIAQGNRTFEACPWTVDTDPVTVMKSAESIGCGCTGVHCSSSTRSFKIVGGSH